MRLQRTREFAAWLERVKDRKTLTRINQRLERAVFFGNLGITRSLGDGLHEMKLDFGPGYRVYYGRRGGDVLLLLLGGDKSTQARDIVRARWLLENWTEEG